MTTGATIDLTVSDDRLAALALELVRIPSPTLHNHEVARRFAAELEEVGLQVECHSPFPESVVVIGRLPGTGSGPTLEFNGHLDHVPVPHAAPELKDGRLYGRGSIDMKANLASVVEALRALSEAGVRLAGDVLVSAQGLHEAPGDYQHSEDREMLLRSGVHGDACIVVEGPNDNLPISFGGLTIFEVELWRDGTPTHELMTESGTENPLYLGARLAQAIEARNRQLWQQPLKLLGPDSYHLGILEGGDYFNRFPTKCRLVGTRRNSPGCDYHRVLAELSHLVDAALAGSQIRSDVRLKNTRSPGELAPDHQFVSLFQRSFEEVASRRLPVTGLRLATDVPLFLEHGVPALCHGPVGGGAHEDVEWVSIDSLAECARLWALLAVDYCGISN